MEELKKQVLGCKRCLLNETKNSYVFGEGDNEADVVFVGEAPGAEEDKTSRPFVGRAGQILNELLESIGLNRDNIYICNILKCRPPGNRDPLPIERNACTPYLDRQIEIINPKLICPLGNHATKYIMEKYGLKDKITAISKLHSQIFKGTNIFGSVKIMPMYHPAIATYTPDMKEVLLKDFKLLEAELE